ncbi:MAG: glycoside hydrolase family 9 protein [Deltaproteobacteria bacterium]|nr:glycoside hydrolase family 9 protein [Deltaproteobacteria bacterium]
MKTISNFFKLSLLTVFAASCGAPAPKTANISADQVQTVTLADNETKPSPFPGMPGVNIPTVKVDTVGYPVGWKKIVIFNVDPAGAVVKNEQGQDIIGITSDMVTNYGLDNSSKDLVWQVDISAVNTPGTYYIDACGGTNGKFCKSDKFVVDEYWKVYKKAVVALVKSFYFQRTRTALTKPWAVWDGDEFIREGVSHVHEDVGWDFADYPEKKKKWQDSPDKMWFQGEQIKKGWFDAGNYDMYIPSTGPSTQILLYSYELHPDLFMDKDQNIPESGNGVPDILDESTWGLDWILSMQQKDGGFRFGEAEYGFGKAVDADKDREPRYIRSVSSSATAKGGAVMAQAATIYKKFPAYKGIASNYEKSAKMGWEWLRQNPGHVRFDRKGSPQPPWDDNERGEQYTDNGARFAAMTEMWLRFREPTALEEILGFTKVEKFKEVTDPHAIATGSWVNISRYGIVALAMDTGTPAEVRNWAKGMLKRVCDEILMPVAEKDGYKVLSNEWDYYWGHNANLAEKTFILAMTAHVTGEAKYMEHARDQWHWLMGRNPNSYAMATRVGKGIDAFYHMEWGPYNPPPPGYAIGGPNQTKLCKLAPGAPAKVLIWDNQNDLETGTPAHTLFHWRQEELWEGGFTKNDSWDVGWWEVTETDLLYSAGFVLAGISVRDTKNVNMPAFAPAPATAPNLAALQASYKRRPPRPPWAETDEGTPGEDGQGNKCPGVYNPALYKTAP